MPEHTVEALAVELTVGNVFTVIVFVDVPIHPFASVPVTVYVVVAIGVKAVPFVTPPVQL